MTEKINKYRAFERVNCILCGCDESEILAEKGQYNLPAYVSICPNDGLVFLNPRWSKEKYKFFYQNEYDHFYRANVFEEETDKVNYRTIREINQRLLKHSTLTDKGNVLDIGAGMGWSLKFLKDTHKNFENFAAIESSQYCIEHIKKHLGFTVLSDDIDSNWHLSVKKKFDLIIMRHVLEHLLNPVSALEKIRNVLTKDGILYIAVPDMMNPSGSLKHHWFRCVHTFYYSPVTLGRLTNLAGLNSHVLKQDNSELWGIFRKGAIQDYSFKNVYKKQLNIIRYQKVKNFFYHDLKKFVKGIIAN